MNYSSKYLMAVLAGRTFEFAPGGHHNMLDKGAGILHPLPIFRVD